MLKMFLVIIVFVMFPLTAHASDWVRIPSTDSYLNMRALEMETGYIVKATTMTKTNDGYFINLERYSLDSNTICLDASIDYSADGKILSWMVFKRPDTLWERFKMFLFGESEFKKIASNSNGQKILDYLKKMRENDKIKI